MAWLLRSSPHIWCASALGRSELAPHQRKQLHAQRAHVHAHLAHALRSVAEQQHAASGRRGGGGGGRGGGSGGADALSCVRRGSTSATGCSEPTCGSSSQQGRSACCVYAAASDPPQPGRCEGCGHASHALPSQPAYLHCIRPAPHLVGVHERGEGGGGGAARP